MGKRLIIAEKPSVARDIASALSVPKMGQSYFESPDLVVSSALGHLFELSLPENLSHCKEKWDLKDLPLLPSHFDLIPLTHAKAQLNVLLGLLKRQDITGVINACDAGREGELIFLYILRYARCNKPVERLWLQSMTTGAICESFKKLRTGESMRHLADAAVSRAESDWLVGINGSRVLSLTNPVRKVTPVGRVQTPTLALVVARDQEIKQFVPKDYWLVKSTFQVRSGTYIGTWYDPNFKGEGKSERIWEKAKAEQIRARCLGKSGTVTEQTVHVSKNCPPLFDLTSLQREANKKLGFSAAKTLKLAQELYETYKVLTYPRTDAKVLPDDYVPVALKTMDMLASRVPSVQPHAKQVLSNGWIKPDKRIFNSAKVTDHFAIIPTSKEPEVLPSDEAALYDMVTRRFVAVFFPAAEYLDTERITKISNDWFKSRGRVTMKPGWTLVYGADALADEDKDKDKEVTSSLTAVGPNELPLVAQVMVAEEKTKPAPHFNEAALLSAMESAGKLVDDDELREAMAARGLGTPATRAAIIEGLLHSEYIERKKKELWATEKGLVLIDRLKQLALDSLCSPQLTGDWEHKLITMEQGKTTRAVFMQDIQASVVMLVSKVKNTAPKPEIVKDWTCPTCKKNLLSFGGEMFNCPDKHVAFRRQIAKRVLTDDEIKTLLTTGSIGPLAKFISKEGKPFSAKLKWNEQGGIAFDFGPAAVTTPVGDFDGWKISEATDMFIAEKAKQRIIIRKLICNRPIMLPEVHALLKTGSTGVLEGFISKASKPFKATLAVKLGKVEFVFN